MNMFSIKPRHLGIWHIFVAIPGLEHPLKDGTIKMGSQSFWSTQWQLLWTLKLEYLNRSGGISQWSTMWHSDLPLIRFWSRWNAVPHSWVRIYEKTAVSVVSASIGGRRSWLKKHPTKRGPHISMLSNRSTEPGLWNMFVACILIVVCCIMLFPHSFGSSGVDLFGCRRKKQVVWPPPGRLAPPLRAFDIAVSGIFGTDSEKGRIPKRTEFAPWDRSKPNTIKNTTLNGSVNIPKQSILFIDIHWFHPQDRASSRMFTRAFQGLDDAQRFASSFCFDRDDTGRRVTSALAQTCNFVLLSAARFPQHLTTPTPRLLSYYKCYVLPFERYILIFGFSLHHYDRFQQPSQRTLAMSAWFSIAKEWYLALGRVSPWHVLLG